MTVMRFILAGQCHGDGACYEAAYQAAETVLDLPQAVELVARVTGLVRVIRRERDRAFHFLPANCCRMTGDEQYLLGALRAAIDGDHAAFPVSLSLLSRGVPGLATGQALVSLAQALVVVGLAARARPGVQ